MSPSAHANPRQTWPVTVGKNAEPLHSSPNGSRAAVSAIPTTTPELLSPDHTTLLFGPPSVPRSVIAPSRHSAAWRTVLLGRLEKPATPPRLLMASPRLAVPPSVEV